MRKLAIACLLLATMSVVCPAQDPETAAGAPPRYFMFVHQQFKPGKAAERSKLEISAAQGFDSVNAPPHWIEAESLTGPPQALFMNPFESFEELEAAFPALNRIYSQHPELGRIQQQIEDLIESSKIIIAVRRDDLGGTADLAKARYVRLTVLFGQLTSEDRDSAVLSDCRCVVYEVNSGAQQPAYVLLQTMHSLSEADDVVASQANNPGRSDKAGAFPRESNIYVIHPEMSHVGYDLAVGDPSFWKARMPVERPSPPAKK